MNQHRQTADNPTGNAVIDALRSVPSADDIEALRERNARRAREAAQAMGTRYCCHPANSPTKAKPRPQWPDPPRFLRSV